MYLCVNGIYDASFYDFDLILELFRQGVVFFVFRFIITTVF
jgi:hypothetical protein